MSGRALAALAVVGWLAIGAATSSCGYRFIAPNGALPEGIRTVSVPVFKNETSDPGAEAAFTQALRDIFLRSGKLANDNADAVVEGTLLSISSLPLAASPGQLPNYRMTVSVRLVLRKDAKVVGGAMVNGSEEFPPGADVLWSETYRSLALKRMAESLMRDGADQLSSSALSKK